MLKEIMLVSYYFAIDNVQLKNIDVFKIAYTFKINEDNHLELLSVNINNQNRLRSTTSVLNISKPKQLYTSKLPISAQKYKELGNLCEKKTIPEVYHEEYLSLPFKTTIVDQDEKMKMINQMTNKS
ncbi:hypothetical protein ACI65C_013710 [Semiaphis heraclei]